MRDGAPGVLTQRKQWATFMLVGVACVLGSSGCGPDDVPISPAGVPVIIIPVTYSVGGNVVGLSGANLTLQDGLGNRFPITVNGSFTLPTLYTNGEPYSVTVSRQPNGQVCTVTNGTGTVGTANVTNVEVRCGAGFAVNVTVSGLLGSGLVLRNDPIGESLPIPTDGTYTFVQRVGNGATYSVTVATQPSAPAQACGVTAGTGTIAGTDVTVTVTCASNVYSIGGALAGLAGGVVEIELINTISTSRVSVLQPTINGAFSFPSTVPDGFAYTVQVSVQPSTPAQVCSVANDAGTVATANINNVQVTCVSPPWAGIKQFGSPGFDSTTGVAVDASGNVYIAGSSNGAIAGASGTATEGPFVAKYDRSGNRLWLRQFGFNALCAPAGLRFDPISNRLVIGGNVSTGIALPGQATLGLIDACIAWLNTDGGIVQQVQFGTAASDAVSGVAVDGDSAVYVAGTRGDIWLAKFNASGVEQWTRTRGSAHGPLDGDLGHAIAVGQGRVYVGGAVAGEIDGEGVAFASGKQAVVLQYDTDGNWNWTRVIAGSSIEFRDARAWGVAVDTVGGVYVAGAASGVTFDGQAISGFSDAFLARFDSTGTKSWTHLVGAAGDVERAWGLGVDPVGFVYLLGEADSSTLDGQSNAGARDALIVKFDATGLRQWTRLLGTTTSDLARAVAVDDNGNPFVVGEAGGALPGSGTLATENAFVAKYDPNGILQ